MLNVFLTVDTEIWCDGWDNLDAKFPAAFKRYVYGPTPKGNYGLPIQLKTLTDHGLTGVFFVEPLFAMRFGVEPLQELVELVQFSGQEVQLHLHTEWVDEAPTPMLPGVDGKRQFLKMFSRVEQTTLIAKGLDLLRTVGAKPINAFRAGNYALNVDTLLALSDNDIEYDSSYNAAAEVGVGGVSPGQVLTQPVKLGDVTEFPVTVYRDRGPASLRPLQLTACSFKEIKHVLDVAAEQGLESVVLVSHNFELLNSGKNRPDPIVVKRFQRICRYLEQNPDRFCVRGFRGLENPKHSAQPEPISSNLKRTGERMATQLVRRAFG